MTKSELFRSHSLNKGCLSLLNNRALSDSKVSTYFHYVKARICNRVDTLLVKLDIQVKDKNVVEGLYLNYRTLKFKRE